MFGPRPAFADRREAGRRLADALAGLSGADPLVLALPRGGVPVAYEVARALRAPLDVVLVRKIGAPHQPELGIGAVVDGADPQVVWNDDLVRHLRPPEDYLKAEPERQLKEIERRRGLYRPDRPPLAVAGRTAIVVDDGIATGGTVRAVLTALRRAGAGRLVLAVPVAPRDALAELRGLADDVVCLEAPDPFHAVGAHYRDFDQTSDEEVVALMERAARESGAPGPGGES